MAKRDTDRSAVAVLRYTHYTTTCMPRTFDKHIQAWRAADGSDARPLQSPA